jgi:cytochrome P450
MVVFEHFSGPIVRINPHEIHINDPEWYSTLNSFRGRWDKDPHTAHQFANPHSSVGTVEHDVHKRRKAAIQPFFAKQKIYELEPVVLRIAQSLCSRLEEYGQRRMVVPMRQALKCYCVDTIAEYCFAKNGDMINRPDFASDHWRNFAKGLDAGARHRYMPKWLLPTVKSAPLWIQASIGPGLQFFELWHEDVAASVDHVEAKADELDSPASSHRTIFEELLRSPAIPKEDKTRPRLIQEGAALIGAGGETTSQILAIVIFGILNDSAKCAILRNELRTVSEPGRPQDLLSLRRLESLPYLVYLRPLLAPVSTPG